MLHGRSPSVGELVAKLRGEDRGLAIDGRILDSPVRHFGRTRFEVYLVNARHTKNLPGRKSDVQESQWLLKLHTYGLLNNSFRPPSKIRMLRTYWRQRLAHVTGAATCAANAKSADANEYSARECDQRSERSDWTADRAGHHRWDNSSPCLKLPTKKFLQSRETGPFAGHFATGFHFDD